MIGVHPGPYTLRELFVMAEGKCKEAWGRTSTLLALLANVNRDPKKRSKEFTPSEFNPYEAREKKKQEEDGKAGFAMMKAAFCKSEKGESK